MPPPRGRLDILSGVITALTERLCRLDARVLAVELGNPTCARLAEVEVTVADLIRSAQTSMDDVIIKNGVYIKLLRSEVGAKLEESKDLNLKVSTSLIALDGIDFRLSLRLDELGESLTAAIRRAEALETSLEVTPTRGAFHALQTDMISVQKKVKRRELSGRGRNREGRIESVETLRESLHGVSARVDDMCERVGCLAREVVRGLGTSCDLSVEASVEAEVSLAQEAAGLLRGRNRSGSCSRGPSCDSVGIEDARWREERQLAAGVGGGVDGDGGEHGRGGRKGGKPGGKKGAGGVPGGQ